METNEPERRHLTDAELSALAIPSAGSPEALPEHLSDCLTCTRALSEWKAALSSVGEEAGPLDDRTEEDWARASALTMARIRSAPRRAPATTRWAVGIAASLLLAVLAMPLLRAGRSGRAGDREGTELSRQDQADDALLRDVDRMTRADDDSGEAWDTLAPEPRGSAKGGTL